MNSPQPVNTVPKFLLQTLNHLYEAERKLAIHGDPAGVMRNIERIKSAFEDERLFFEDPMGQPFNETRVDLEASIAGEGTEHLHVTEVIKPVIRLGDASFSRVVQKGIVVVQAKAVQVSNQDGEQK
jgi:hypothetical protein